ncbi:MAG TPA: hypothetical protein VF974_06695 [Patescibacteria group bacterium]
METLFDHSGQPEKLTPPAKKKVYTTHFMIGAVVFIIGVLIVMFLILGSSGKKGNNTKSTQKVTNNNSYDQSSLGPPFHRSPCNTPASPQRVDDIWTEPKVPAIIIVCASAPDGGPTEVHFAERLDPRSNKWERVEIDAVWMERFKQAMAPDKKPNPVNASLRRGKSA